MFAGENALGQSTLGNVYHNDNYGFSINPPKGWAFYDGSEYAAQFLGPFDDNMNGTVNIAIWVEHNSTISLQSFSEEILVGHNGLKDFHQILKTDGVKAGYACKELVYTFKTENNFIIEVKDTYFVENGNAFLIYYIATPSTYGKYFDIVEQSLQTFSANSSLPLVLIVGVISAVVLVGVGGYVLVRRRSKTKVKLTGTDEKASLTQMTPQTKRPIGIIIISIFWIIGGIYNIITGWTSIITDANDLTQISTFRVVVQDWLTMALPIEMAIFAVFVLLGLLQLVTVTGLLRGKHWAYYAGISIPIIGFIGVGFQTLLMMTSPLGFSENIAALPLFNLFGNFFFMFIYVGYLRQPNVRIWLGVKNKLAESLQKVTDTTSTVSSPESSSENETILLQESDVKQFDSQSPSMYTDQPGTLILTSKRMMYVSMGAWDATALKESISQVEVDYLMKHKKSYSVPLEEITRVEAVRWLSAQYLRVNNCSPGQKNYHSYMFLVQWERDASGAAIAKSQHWVDTINSAITTARSPPSLPPTYYHPVETQSNQIPPQPPESAAVSVPICPLCGASLFYVQEHKRWYCFKDKKYF
jgi:hypothetical protein